MTRRLSRERLKALEGATPRFFAEMLRDGVPGFLAEADRSAFTGVASFIGRSGSVEEDLAFVFGALASPEQAAFRLGVAIAVAELPLDRPFAGPALLSLFRLAALVRATGVVDVVVPVLMAAERTRMPDTTALYRAAFELVVELATPARAAVDCLKMLVSSRGFRDALAAPALLALCRTDPTAFATHLNMLARPLASRYRPELLTRATGRSEEARDELLGTIAQLVPTAAVAEALSSRHRRAWSSGWLVYDWFVRGLSESGDPRVRTLWGEVQAWIADAPDGAAEDDHRGSSGIVEDEFTSALGYADELDLVA